MPNCNCAGNTCSCMVVGGAGVSVQGTGTAAAPYTISIDPSTFQLGNSLQVASSGTVELSSLGTGATNDPVVLSADLVLRSQNGTRYTLAVSNTGVLSVQTAGPARAGSGPSTGITIIENDILYYSPTTGWDARSTTQAHAIYNSLGYTGVPVPPGFKAGDTWLAAAT